MFDSPLQPGEFAWLQLKKSLATVQKQLLARMTNWSSREGWRVEGRSISCIFFFFFFIITLKPRVE